MQGMYHVIMVFQRGSGALSLTALFHDPNPLRRTTEAKYKVMCQIGFRTVGDDVDVQNRLFGMCPAAVRNVQVAEYDRCVPRGPSGISNPIIRRNLRHRLYAHVDARTANLLRRCAHGLNLCTHPRPRFRAGC